MPGKMLWDGFFICSGLKEGKTLGLLQSSAGVKPLKPPCTRIPLQPHREKASAFQRLHTQVTQCLSKQTHFIRASTSLLSSALACAFSNAGYSHTSNLNSNRDSPLILREAGSVSLWDTLRVALSLVLLERVPHSGWLANYAGENWAICTKKHRNNSTAKFWCLGHRLSIISFALLELV